MERMENINQENMKIKDFPKMQNDFNVYFLVSIILAILVILLSAYFYISNNSLQKEIENANNKITEHNKIINELKSNKWIVAYEIVKKARLEINKNIETSYVQNYISELMSISRKYKINFSWFNYASYNITTSALAESTNWEDAIKKISNFIKDYRVWNKTTFLLDPIQSISWDASKRSFQVSFKIAASN